MTAASTFRTVGSDGKIWELVIEDGGRAQLFHDHAKVTGFLPPRELTEDRIRSALTQAGVGTAAAQILTGQVMAE